MFAVAGLAVLILMLTVGMPIDYLAIALCALVIVVGCGLVVPVVSLRGCRGHFTYEASSVRIDHPALLREPWVVPATCVELVRRTPPAISGWSLNLAPAHDTVEVRFSPPGIRAPVRWRFTIFAAVAGPRTTLFMRLPGVRIRSVSMPIILTEADVRYLDLHGVPPNSHSQCA